MTLKKTISDSEKEKIVSDIINTINYNEGLYAIPAFNYEIKNRILNIELTSKKVYGRSKMDFPLNIFYDLENKNLSFDVQDLGIANDERLLNHLEKFERIMKKRKDIKNKIKEKRDQESKMFLNMMLNGEAEKYLVEERKNKNGSYFKAYSFPRTQDLPVLYFFE